MKVELFDVTFQKVLIELPAECPECRFPISAEGPTLGARGVSSPMSFDVDMNVLEEKQLVECDPGGTDYSNCSDFPTKLVCGECGAAVVQTDPTPLERMGIDQQEFDALVLKKAEELIASRKKKRGKG